MRVARYAGTKSSFYACIAGFIVAGSRFNLRHQFSMQTYARRVLHQKQKAVIEAKATKLI